MKKPSATFVHDADTGGYCLKAPFDPPSRHPELDFVRETDPGNRVYGMVRSLLMKLGFDADNAGMSSWNPLGEIISPGDKVLIKPNLLTHRHYLGEDAVYSSIAHGSVLRPLVDYARLALEGRGSIIIADNPVEDTDFEKVMEITGIQAMVEELCRRGYEGLELIDLRPRVVREGKDGKFHYHDQPGDPRGYVSVDLGRESLLAGFDHDPDVHFYTLADPSVDHLDPHFEGRSRTDEYHNPGGHKYVIARTVLDSDVIISAAKLKTHCKAGMTLTLKNMVGIVYLKECLPHHRPGMPPKGDAFPFYPAPHYVASRKIYKDLRERVRIHRLPGFMALRNWLQKHKILVGEHLEHGNWKGNDTIWRMILDLNRIAFYADKEGNMMDRPQRKFLGLIDGIIAQQGDGPRSGDPVVSSILIGGTNPIAADNLAIKAAGMDPAAIRTLSRAAEIERWKIPGEGDVSFDDHGLPELRFEPPKGWK